MLLDINSLFYSWIRGGIFLLLIYHFVFYLKHKEDIYKYYSIYLFGIFIFLIKDVFEGEFMTCVYEYLVFSIQFISFSFYIHFTRKLLNTEEDYPKWNKAAKKVSILLLIIALLLAVVQAFYGFETQKKVLLYGAPVLTIALVGGLAFVEIIKTKVGLYSLLGSIIALLGANITALKIIKDESFLINLNVHHMFYFFVGILIQTIIYAFLIADVLKKKEIEKSRAELNLHKKSAQLYELKMTAFKNRMNPHFLFNSLNSINNFVLQNKKEETSAYISKFSSLIRKVLQTTEKVYISLEEELQIAELYINIELARLRNSFNYEIIVDKDIKTSSIKVVPLYLQPFVENAIWHGLTLQEGNKKLLIKVKEENNYIITEVIDNGVGYKESLNKNKSQGIQRKSFGIDTVKNRLDLIYSPPKVNLLISDMENKGTKVTIVFPSEKF
ncbi:histidine kinase [Tenacibaculum crassostreae]|uniref:histidine kinase n=1 Tax=Tenacibaculum crassostreae TaxID=502683 RepID=UPI0038963E3C